MGLKVHSDKFDRRHLWRGAGPATAWDGRSNSISRFFSLAGLLLAFSLRLQYLGADSLWYDETVSVYLAGLSIPEMIAHTARDIHPPAYYFLLHAWRAVAEPAVGHGLEFLYIWPSLWFGLTTVALVGAIGAHLFGRRAGALALMLAAINPFQLMYSQEARMYSLAATCTLLTLFAALRFVEMATSPDHQMGSSKTTIPALVLYVVGALIGIYTLYYFIFWLAVLVPSVAFCLYRSGAPQRYQTRWGIAQLALFIGWLPWLPTFLRQVLDPPVPPWRVAWSDPLSLLAALAEALAAPLVGQSAPGGVLWPWALLVAGVTVAFYVYTKSWEGHERNAIAALLPALLLGPILIIFAASLLVTPLYHVRYLVTYAPLWLIMAGVLVHHLIARLPLLALFAGLALTGASLAGLQTFRHDPALRADDHRAAVAELAREWRPGDVLLVNAGWVYTALAVYWPSAPSGPHGAAAPPIAAYPRLPAFLETTPQTGEAAVTSWPPVLAARTGSIDGNPSLGWGNPASDFYAVSSATTVDALDALAAAYRRIWHYRLYDTVNDADGLIRAWMVDHGPPFSETTYSGPGFLRVEGIYTGGSAPTYPVTVQDKAVFGDAVELRGHRTAGEVEAGANLYVELDWQLSPTETDSQTTAVVCADAEPPSGLAASLRLHAPDGLLVAQADMPITSAANPVSMALPVPAASPPGAYDIRLVVYCQADLTPLPASSQGNEPSSRRIENYEWPLGQVSVLLPGDPTPAPKPLGRFDYIALAEAHLPATAQAGLEVPLDLVWVPHSSPYQDNYTVTVTLQPESGSTPPIVVAEAPAGGIAYPSALWPAGYPVRQVIPLRLPSGLGPGDYTASLALRRASDERPVRVHARWQPWSQPALPVEVLTVFETQPTPGAQASRVR
jgi:hypothetical protein